MTAGSLNLTILASELRRQEGQEFDSIGYLLHIFHCLRRTHEDHVGKPLPYFLMLTTARGFNWSNNALLNSSKLIFLYRSPKETYTRELLEAVPRGDLETLKSRFQG